MLQDNRSVVRRVLVITLLLNIFVLGLKLFVGMLTGSLSLIADALHSVTDSANNILGLITNQFASPFPDREHPYGHRKFEAVGALGIAAFLGVACFEILQGAVERIISGENQVKVSPSELWILLIVLGVNIFVAVYERWVGKRIGSPILVADAIHTMSDVWVTIGVIGGLIGVWLGYRWLDIAIAFPVALMVFWSGWHVIRQNLPWLVDQMAVPPEEIYEIVIAVPGVVNVHDIASRGLRGRQVFMEMHLIVDTDDVNTAHQITELVEQKLAEKYSPVRILIHVEPPTYRSDQISF
ncbi:cation diffusion facilitator family transporter [Calothrix sp. NIES-3974]|uniref:cation diffusion facilitator family transporter n=1 Tax=Calothrix sp. NIES-3974 TaxID=2005462 RepID=UPI000B60D207|nr:cation diffusion facilitator family transporter [Calothrix sp. NIES-3974]BAZ06470.1 cation diffusion facilitator family transporter [Calothrix sp. NIES-3974]